MRKTFTSIFLLFSLLSYGQCIDPAYTKLMTSWNSAGIHGGHPTKSYSIVSAFRGNLVHSSINGTTSLQTELNTVSLAGGGIIIMKKGKYEINDFDIPSNVILKGEDIDEVIIETRMRSSKSSIDETAVVEFQDGTTTSGIANLTIHYVVDNCDINNYLGTNLYSPPRYQKEYYTNTPCARTDLEVTGIEVRPNASNILIKDVKILAIGSNPIKISGDHNTIENCYLAKSYMKGTSGQGYFEINGNYNLIINTTVTGIRHFSLQQYNAGRRPGNNVIVYNKLVGVDYNIHNADAGRNLFEGNEVRKASWSSWGPFHTGHRCCHTPPETSNWLVNNTLYNDKGSLEFSVPHIIYRTNGTFKTLSNEGLEDSGLVMSNCGKFYTARAGNTSGVGFHSPNDSQLPSLLKLKE